MSILQAVLLGILQGITEIFPISISGLALIEAMFQVDMGGAFFGIFLYVGTLLGISAVFHKDMLALLKACCLIGKATITNVIRWVKGIGGTKKIQYIEIMDTPYKKLFGIMMISIVPIIILTILSGNMEEQARHVLFIPAIGSFLTALFLAVANRLSLNKKETSFTYVKGILIGTCAGLAIIPGISRIGIIFLICSLCGVNRKQLVKLSLLMSIPGLIVSIFMRFSKIELYICSKNELICGVTGMMITLLVSMITIKLLTRFITKGSLRPFIFCNILMGCCLLGTFYVTL